MSGSLDNIKCRESFHPSIINHINCWLIVSFFVKELIIQTPSGSLDNIKCRESFHPSIINHINCWLIVSFFVKELIIQTPNGNGFSTIPISVSDASASEWRREKSGNRSRCELWAKIPVKTFPVNKRINTELVTDGKEKLISIHYLSA